MSDQNIDEESLSREIRSTIEASLTTFLNEFSGHMAVGNRPKAAVSAAQVAQMGLFIFEVFSSGAEAICASDADAEACNAAATVVRDVMERNLERWYNDSLTDVEKGSHLN